MKKRLKPLIVGNWKMNPATLARAEKIFVDIQKGLRGRVAVSDIAIAPPLPFITELQQLTGSQKISFIAQDVSAQEVGPHTGEVGTSMLRSIHVRASIVGHSERRAKGETDEIVNQKLIATVKEKLTAILCVGEKERDNAGDYFNVVEYQLSSALKGIKAEDLKHIVVAYEPVWAIGTGKHATVLQAEEMRLFIQKVLSDIYGRSLVASIRVLYGGSVTADNADELLRAGKADGFLIGGASLEAKEFVSIIKTADHYAKLS